MLSAQHKYLLSLTIFDIAWTRLLSNNILKHMEVCITHPHHCYGSLSLHHLLAAFARFPWAVPTLSLASLFLEILRNSQLQKCIQLSIDVVVLF